MLCAAIWPRSVHRAAGRAPCPCPEAHGCRRLFNENGEIVVPDCVRGALRSLVGQIDALDEAIGSIDRELAAAVKVDETAKRLMTIPGVGPVTASAIVATIQDASAFASGREFAAFLEPDATPGTRPAANAARAHHQDGDRYLRKCFWWWAPALTLRHRRGHTTTPCVYGRAGCSSARRSNTSSIPTTVALANKIARIVFVLMTRGGHYDDRPVAA